MIISQLSISPVGKNVSLGKYVKIAIESIRNEGIKFQTNAMATVIETEDLDTLFTIVKRAHNAVLSSGAKRVITELKIDDRKDKNVTIEKKDKVGSIKLFYIHSKQLYVTFSFRGLGRGIIMVSESLVEICFHGRGGQGAVTAANLLVEAAFKDGNNGVQAFPFFGAERRGAPVRAFARISGEEIHLRSEIYNPDFVIVLDESIMGLVDTLKGLKENGTVLINTTKKPEDFNFSNKYHIATVDATGIAIKYDILVGGIPVVNTPILGAVPKILNRVTLPSIQTVIRAKWKGEQSDRNVKATNDAFNEVEVNF